MNAEEAARFLGLSVSMFRKLEPVEAIYIGSKTVRYHIEDLQAWAQAMKRRGRPTSNQVLIARMHE